MDLGKLYADAAKIDCTGVAAATDMDTKVNIFNDNIIKLYDIHASLKSIKMKHTPAPW